jgi:hypothetical protein
MTGCDSGDGKAGDGGGDGRHGTAPAIVGMKGARE